MSQVTTHILNTSSGRPAPDVEVVLYQLQNDAWIALAKNRTDSNGRISNFLQIDLVLQYGTYKLRFNTSEYFQAFSIATFYPFVEIVFEIATAEHYHIPLLLNPFGYTTYRGS